MSTRPPHEITRLLAEWGQGDRRALDELLPLVHAELRRIARRQMGGERAGHTLEATALVNEAYLRLAGQGQYEWHDRAHFYAVCAEVMRHVLVDHARSRTRAKRGGGAVQVSLEEAALLDGGRGGELLALDEALRALEEVDAQKAKVVALRYFAGLTVEETGEVLGLSPTTVRREWRRARAWLFRAITEGEGDETRPLAAG